MTETGFVETDSVQLYYEVTGEGHPLVFVHAGIADHTMWDEHIDAFAQHYRVINYDLRGFGRSVTDGVPFSHYRDLAVLFEHLNVNHAHLVGASFGGKVAMNVALEYPSRVDSLVMVAGVPDGFEHPPTETERELFERDEALTNARDADGLADLDVRLWVNGPGQPTDRAPADVRRKIRASASENYRSYFERFPPEAQEPRAESLTPPATERLAEIRAPTLFVTGELDVSEVEAAAEYAVEEMPDAQWTSFPDVAHMVSMEASERFTEMTLDFLNERTA